MEVPSFTIKQCCASYGDYQLTAVLVMQSGKFEVTEVAVSNKDSVVLSQGRC